MDSNNDWSLTTASNEPNVDDVNEHCSARITIEEKKNKRKCGGQVQQTNSTNHNNLLQHSIETEARRAFSE